MNDFTLFFEQGWKHITDVNGYDHMLFIATLALGFLTNQFRKLLILITAFTIGHSLALAAAVLGWVKLDSDLIEMLIPITITISALRHIVFSKKGLESNMGLQYGIITVFGLIHGLGFSNYLGMLLGSSDQFGIALLGFNIGLEFGQILILACVLGINLLILNSFKISLRNYRLVGGICLTVVGLMLIFS